MLGAEPGARRALGRAAQVGLEQVRHAQVRLAQVRHPRVRLAQVGPVAVIPQWISKMQGSAEGGNVPVSSPIVAAPLTVAGCDCKLPVRWSCGTPRRSSVGRCRLGLPPC